MTTTRPLRGVPAGHGDRARGRRVAVFGAGPAGLTAVHELAERGFEVDVYESFSTIGGKCRSLGSPGTGTHGRPDMPLTMGGHFFGLMWGAAGEMLSRIPDGPGRTVLDNLTTTQPGMKATLFWGENATVVNGTPRTRAAGRVASLNHLKRLLTVVKSFKFLPAKDIPMVASKAMALLTSGEDRRWGQLEHLALPDYLRNDRLSERGGKISAFMCMSWVANDRGMNTRAFAELLDQFCNTFAGRHESKLTEYIAILRRPENEAWFDPWERYLRELGVRVHLRHTLTGLSYQGGRVTGATVRDAHGQETLVEADYFVLAVPPDVAAPLLNGDMAAADPALGRIARLEQFHGISLRLLLKHRVPELGILFTSISTPWQTGNEVLSHAWDLDLRDYGDGEAHEYVSIQLDDSSWNRLPGMLYGKPAKDCTATELIDEVLAQFRHHLSDGNEVFAASAIHSWQPAAGIELHPDRPLTPMSMWASSPSCWENQPDPVTKIANFFLAGSYTRCVSPYDCIDAATESGKRAAAGIIEAAAVTTTPVWLPTSRSPPGAKDIAQAR